MIEDYVSIIIMFVFLALSFYLLIPNYENNYLNQDYVNRAFSSVMLAYPENYTRELGIVIVDNLEDGSFSTNKVNSTINLELSKYFSRYNYYIYYNTYRVYSYYTTNNTSISSVFKLPNNYKFILEVEK